MADRDPWEVPTGAASDGKVNPWEAPRTAAPAAQPYGWDAGMEAVNSALLGAGPTINGIIAGLTGGDYVREKAAWQQAQKAYEAAHPIAAPIAATVGGIAPAAALTAAGLPVVAAGAVQGAAPAVFQGDPGGAALGGAIGAGAGAASQLLGRALLGLGRSVGVVSPAAPTAAAVPASQELLDTGGAQFDALRNTGATFPAATVRGTAAQQAADLNRRGVLDIPGQGASTHAILDRMGGLGTPAAPAPANPMQAVTGVVPQPTPETPVPVAELDAMRKAFGNVRPSASISKTDAAAARGPAQAILDLYAQHSPQLADLSANARGNYGAGLQSQAIEDAILDARNGAQSTGSGMNADNKYRQAARGLLNSDKFSTPVEQALQAAIDGSRGQNFLRGVSNRIGGGGGLGSMIAGLGAGSAVGGAGWATGNLPAILLGAGIPVAGHVAREVENSMSRRALQAAATMARQQSPLYQQNVANFVPPVPGLGATLGRALAPAIGGAVAPGIAGLFEGQ